MTPWETAWIVSNFGAFIKTILKLQIFPERKTVWRGKKVMIWDRACSRRIFYAPSAISVHGSFRQASLESGPSGQELRTLPTGQLRRPSLRRTDIVAKIHPFPLSNSGSVVERRTGNQRSPVRIPSTASRRKYSFSSILLSVYLC